MKRVLHQRVDRFHLLGLLFHRTNGWHPVHLPRPESSRSGDKWEFGRFSAPDLARVHRTLALGFVELGKSREARTGTMKRSHRRWHFAVWLVLTPILTVGVLAAWLAKPTTTEWRADGFTNIGANR